MSNAGLPHPDLVAHLTTTTGLRPAECARLIADVLAYFDETVEEFVRRRHAELRAHGGTNAGIFERIRTEVPMRRVAAPELSLRQLRRIVYG